jgi:hypothetical protein
MTDAGRVFAIGLEPVRLRPAAAPGAIDELTPVAVVSEAVLR